MSEIPLGSFADRLQVFNYGTRETCECSDLTAILTACPGLFINLVGTK